jgi:hypothetical protein
VSDWIAEALAKHVVQPPLSTKDSSGSAAQRQEETVRVLREFLEKHNVPVLPRRQE